MAERLRVRGMCLALLVSLTTLASAQSVRYESTLDWTRGVVSTVALVDVSEIADSPFAARAAGLDSIRSLLPDHLLRFLGEIPLTSSSSVGDLLRSSAGFRREIVDYSMQVVPSASYADTTLSELSARFTHELYPGLMEHLVLHSRPEVREPFIGFAPTTEYSGVVIYAKGEYPVHGEPGTDALLRPALLPRIYNESMELIFDVNMVDPSLVIERGVVGYTDAIDLDQERDRIGSVPLVTMAREIFGTNRTDLIITDEVSDRLLSNTRNRALLESGRIVIICDL